MSTSGLRIGPKKIWNEHQVIAQLDLLIPALKGMGTTASATGMDSDPMLEAWQLASAIRKTLGTAVELRPDITPDGQRAKAALRPELEAVHEKADRLFSLVGAMITQSREAEDDLQASQRAMPGIEHRSRGAVDSYRPVDTGDERVDALSRDALDAGQNLNARYTALENILKGSTVRMDGNTRVTVIGNYDFAGSVKKAADTLLGKGVA